MKKIAALSAALSFVTATTFAAPNPAAVYCESLGYDYRIVRTDAGEKGVVNPAPGVELDAWDFFRGKMGAEYSYGALLGGYETICVVATNGAYVEEYALCVPTAAGRARGLQPVRQEELMRRNGHWLDSGGRSGRNFNAAGAALDFEPLPERTLPAAFDWRNVGGRAYIGSIRDQGDCGSCYAFSACAAAEGVYNYARGVHGSGCADFSESFLIWCLAGLPQYGSHFYGCYGADYDYYELAALAAEGICREWDFSYTVEEPDECAHWSKPRVVFESWHRVPCNDIEAIKTAIITYGVVDAAVLTTPGFFNYAGGIYEDGNTNCTASPCYYARTDHVVSLVGWDDAPPEGGGGCWILRNSWGTSWGEGGYMRIRYRSAAVACAAAYLRYPATTSATRFTPNKYFNDRCSALAVYDSAAGRWYMTDADSQTNLAIIDFGGAGCEPVPGDYDGDGVSDLAVYHEPSGMWYVRDVAGEWSIFGVAWGGPGFSPVGGDYDGDGVSDLAVYHEPSGMWYVRDIAGEWSIFGLPWGGPGFSAVSGDYNGDGASELGVYGAQNGRWHITTPDGTWAQANQHWGGAAGMLPVPGDYNGDGAWDLAVYHEPSGTWYVRDIAGQWNIFGLWWGGPGLKPVPGDYNGDGVWDFAVYAQESGRWYITSAGGQWMRSAVWWGGPGLEPVGGLP